MSVDKFGKHISKKEDKNLRGPPGKGFNLTLDGNYDVQNKLIKNLKDPEDIYDAATKNFVESQFKVVDKLIEKINKCEQKLVVLEKRKHKADKTQTDDSSNQSSNQSNVTSETNQSTPPKKRIKKDEINQLKLNKTIQNNDKI